MPLQNVGSALRDLLSKVDKALQDLPHQTQREVCGGEKREEVEGRGEGDNLEEQKSYLHELFTTGQVILWIDASCTFSLLSARTSLHQSGKFI